MQLILFCYTRMRSFLMSWLLFSTYLSAADPFAESPLMRYYINANEMPLVISPHNVQVSLEDFRNWAESYRDELKVLTAEHGALLLRGFPVENPEDFIAVVHSVLGMQTMDYRSGEGSRTKVAHHVYTSTEAPANFHIPLHHELSCTNTPSSYICFYCDIAPEKGTGQTLLGKTQSVTEAIFSHEKIWELFYGKMIHYISRHPPEGSIFSSINPTHKSWQQSFETADREEVEKICSKKGFRCTWNGDWIEVMRTAPAIREADDIYDSPYWYNQAHLYHSNVKLHGGWVNHILASLLYFSATTRPYDVEFADGSPIPHEIIYQIYEILEKETIRFDWQEQDVLVVDNRRALHGKAPYQGPRRILTALVP